MVMKKDKNLMSVVIDWKNEIGSIAGPFLPSDTKESWLGRAHRAVSKINKDVTFRTIERMFYGYVKDPKYSVASSVLSAAEQARLEDARRDAARLADIYASAAGGLREIDENFHRETIDALVHASRVFSSVDRA